MKVPKRAKLLRFIRDRIADTEAPPTFAEMADYMGIKTKSSVHAMVNRLIEDGKLIKGPRGWRSLTLPPEKNLAQQYLSEIARLCAGAESGLLSTEIAIQAIQAICAEATIQEDMNRTATISTYPVLASEDD